MKDWYLYILQCGDDTLYTGITVDVDKRFLAHKQGKGAKYTRSRGVKAVVYRELCGTKPDALRREIAVKKLSRQEKEKMISGV